MTLAWQDPNVSTHNYWMAPQNVIVTVPLKTNPPRATPEIAWTPSPRAASPSSGYVSYSISKCPGVIDQTPNACNGRSAITFWSFQYVATPTASYPNQGAANAAGLCWAPLAEGPWYLNFRYEQFVSRDGTPCPEGRGECGVNWEIN